VLALASACVSEQLPSATTGQGATSEGEATTFPPGPDSGYIPPLPTDTGEAPPPIEPPPPGTLRFAVIGDFGLDEPPTIAVAALVASWSPELVLTLGDNNYYVGAAETIDVNIGKHYSRFIHPYVGEYGRGAKENRFFPCPGNHDWQTGTLQPYLDYFTLPGNERYYSVRRGPVEFFLIDSDYHEPDGLTPGQAQGQWLEAALAESEAQFQVVLMHHPPYSSGWHQSTTAMRWPYAEWGADLVLAGHEHDYERLVVDGLPYVIAGTGGASLRSFSLEASGSQRGHPDTFGALRIEADEEWLSVEMVAPDGARIDRLNLAAVTPESWLPRVPVDATWRHREGDAPVDWKQRAFTAEGWASGPAPLGFGVGGEGTVLPGGDAEDRPITTYFRHRFQAEAADIGAPIRLRIAVDDGAIVHLNNHELYRINMPDGPVDGRRTAPLPVGDWFPDRMSETLVPGDALLAGDNVLAVEVHQHAANSSDLRFALELAVGR
jgi:tartrate-resistant acid phosphatase type 5